jgi:pyruvate/2-oxoglutarate dehydrogenase complex dihydrolipoamide dehydrogenase (E3) component
MLDVIVLGGGPAGVTAALRARELGASVALVERGRMGGVCTYDGCAPTRVLAKAARLMRDAEQFDEYGLSRHVPTLDWQALLTRTQQTIYRLQEKKQLLTHLAQAGVRVLAETGEARFVDAHTLALPDAATLTAEKFILCTGGHARRLTFPGSAHALTHSDVWQMKRAPRSLVVVGAAATGCQLASIFRAFGAQVTLLEVAPRLLPAEDLTTSETMRAAFEQSGIRVVAGIERLERVEPTAAGLELHFRQNEQAHRIEAEAVILAVGWAGNVDGLGLADAGVMVERGYVQVDDYLRTSAPHIFAAGDITGRMMLVQSAGYEARIAAENAVLGAQHTFQHRITPHGGFTDPEYSSVGLTEDEARREYDCAAAVVPYSDLDRAVIDDRPAGFCKLIAARDSRRILGAHVVGEQAVEVVQLVAAGMAADARVEQLADLELAYPTFTSIVGLAARQLARELRATPLAAQWQALRRWRAAEWEGSQQP